MSLGFGLQGCGWGCLGSRVQADEGLGFRMRALDFVWALDFL